MSYNFTEDEVLNAVKATFDEPICMDMIDDARCEPTLLDAVEVIIIDSAYWNGTC